MLSTVCTSVKAAIFEMWATMDNDLAADRRPSLQNASSVDTDHSACSPPGGLRHEQHARVAGAHTPLSESGKCQSGITSFQLTQQGKGSDTQPSKALVDYPSSEDEEETEGRDDHPASAKCKPAGVNGISGRVAGTVIDSERYIPGSASNAVTHKVSIQSVNWGVPPTIRRRDMNHSSLGSERLTFMQHTQKFKNTNADQHTYVNFNCSHSLSPVPIEAPPASGSSPGDIHYHIFDEGIQYWTLSADKKWENAMIGTAHPVLGSGRVLSHRNSSQASITRCPQWVLRETLVTYRSRDRKRQLQAAWQVV